MDEVVLYLDEKLLSPIFSKLQPNWPQFIEFCTVPNSLLRQILTLYLIVAVGGTILYLSLASFNYLLYYKIFKSKYYPDTDPQPFPGQVQAEIKLSFQSIPIMAHLTVPFFLLEINGYSRLYDRIDEYGWPYFIFSAVFFLLFSDTLIYWIHWGLHQIPWVYKNIHKIHHEFKVPTPYAALAFHPLDGWSQSLPYHFFPLLFPMHKWLSLIGFVFVQMWSVLIHDGVNYTPFEFINGAAHHTFHHGKFNYNYGQFFTFWDKIMNTHMNPFYEYDKEIKAWVPTKIALPKGG